MVSEFRVGQVTRSGLGSLSLQDRPGLSGHSLRLCLSSWYGDVYLAINKEMVTPLFGNSRGLFAALHLSQGWEEFGKRQEGYSTLR